MAGPASEGRRPIGPTMSGSSRSPSFAPIICSITRTRDAQWRPCQLDTTPMVEAGDWIAELRAQTELRLDRLEPYLAQIQAPPQPNPPGEPL